MPAVGTLFVWGAVPAPQPLLGASNCDVLVNSGFPIGRSVEIDGQTRAGAAASREALSPKHVPDCPSSKRGNGNGEAGSDCVAKLLTFATPARDANLACRRMLQMSTANYAMDCALCGSNGNPSLYQPK